MEQATTIGLDIAKHVFQVHGADDIGATNGGQLRQTKWCGLTCSMAIRLRKRPT
jgi:hypothetical protein